jgi:hypothetical protein
MLSHEIAIRMLMYCNAHETSLLNNNAVKHLVARATGSLALVPIGGAFRLRPCLPDLDFITKQSHPTRPRSHITTTRRTHTPRDIAASQCRLLFTACVRHSRIEDPDCWHATEIRVVHRLPCSLPGDVHCVVTIAPRINWHERRSCAKATQCALVARRQWRK